MFHKLAISRARVYCPKCRYKDTKVADSRVASDGLSIRRRRECGRARCGFRFSTVEEVSILDLTVIKRDGHREPYAHEKVLAGLRKAFERRPITSDEFRRLVSGIERDVQLLRKPEVRSSEIGEIILRHLHRADEVAYVRFLSVYKSFEDLASFRKALDVLEGRNGVKKTRRTARGR